MQTRSKTGPTPEENFRLSRIYAKGWNAARSQSMGPAPSNPFTSEPERGRWDEGFNGALEHYRTGPRFKRVPLAKADS